MELSDIKVDRFLDASHMLHKPIEEDLTGTRFKVASFPGPFWDRLANIDGRDEFRQRLEDALKIPTQVGRWMLQNGSLICQRLA